MTAQYIKAIEALAAKLPDRDVPLYFPDFNAEPPADSLNQVFGAPVGPERDSWPIFAGLPELLQQASETDPGDDLRMEHVFTVDLRGLSGLPVPAGARALQLYISNAGYHEGWSPGTGHTHVVVLSDAEVARGPFAGELPVRSQDRRVKRFTLVPVMVPSAVFDKVEDDTPLAKLRTAIYRAPARLGGEPIWLQGDPDEAYDEFGGDDGDGDDESGDDASGDDASEEATSNRPKTAAKPLGLPAFGFYMQFDEKFADVNLGDGGVMYVFGDDAHFQCH